MLRQKKHRWSWFLPTCWTWLRECKNQPGDCFSGTICLKWWRISCLIRAQNMKEQVVTQMTLLTSSSLTCQKWTDSGSDFSTSQATKIGRSEKSNAMSYESPSVKILFASPTSMVSLLKFTSKSSSPEFLRLSLLARTPWPSSTSWSA